MKSKKATAKKSAKKAPLKKAATKQKPAAKPAPKKVAKAKAIKPVPEVKQQIAPITMHLPIHNVYPDIRNPRKQIDEDKLSELAESIKEHGLIQPVAVRKIDSDEYMIIAGERRWRASVKAGLARIECRVYDVDDTRALEMMLIENLQRSDIDPVSEAESILELCKGGRTIADIARTLGKSAHWTACRIKLGSMEPSIKEMVSNGEITPKHVEHLARIDDIETRRALSIRSRTWTAGELAREVERLLRTVDKAPFPRTEEFVSNDGLVLSPCSTCLKRTDRQNDLFGPTDSARCCDPQCWESKLETHRQNIIVDLRKKKYRQLDETQARNVRYSCNRGLEFISVKEGKETHGIKKSDISFYVSEDCEIELWIPRIEEEANEEPLEIATEEDTDLEDENRGNQDSTGIPDWKLNQEIRNLIQKEFLDRIDEVGLQKCLLIIYQNQNYIDDSTLAEFQIQSEDDFLRSEMPAVKTLRMLTEEALSSTHRIQLLTPIIEILGLNMDDLTNTAKEKIQAEREAN